jgi:hypothetical protein
VKSNGGLRIKAEIKAAKRKGEQEKGSHKWHL